MSDDIEQKPTGSKVQPAGYGYGNLPSFSKQKFLSVHVPKGSSISQIAAAVEKALASPEVPFFKDRTPNSAPPAPSSGSQQFAMQAGAAAPAGNGDGDNGGLLILVQQEGRP